MFVAGFPAQAFDTNCYVVAPQAGEECVVVDPGYGVQGQLDEVLAEHGLRPVAVLLTHGHLDHTFSVTPVCGAKDVPAYIHTDDTALLERPERGLSTEMVGMLGGLDWAEPDDVKPLADGEAVQLAGLEIAVDHAPGHTRGSVLFRLPADGDTPEVCLAGDVLFAGSIGRTDLPGGDHVTMMETLRTRVLPLPDEMAVLPGHGPQTSIGRERRTNPFLRELADPHA